MGTGAFSEVRKGSNKFTNGKSFDWFFALFFAFFWWYYFIRFYLLTFIDAVAVKFVSWKDLAEDDKTKLQREVSRIKRLFMHLFKAKFKSWLTALSLHFLEVNVFFYSFCKVDIMSKLSHKNIICLHEHFMEEKFILVLGILHYQTNALPLFLKKKLTLSSFPRTIG